jgi:F-type H+-transporting ATPase subunit gamma
LDGNESKYSQQREVKKVLMVAIVSNRGLGRCAFNTQVFRQMVKAQRKRGKTEPNTRAAHRAKRPWTYRRHQARSTLLPDTDGASLFDGLNFDKVAPKAELIMAKLSPTATYDRIVWSTTSSRTLRCRS